MRNLLLGGLMSLALTLHGAMAEAGGYHRHHHHRGYSGAAVVAGVAGGVLLGAALARPRYYGSTAILLRPAASGRLPAAAARRVLRTVPAAGELLQGRCLSLPAGRQRSVGRSDAVLLIVIARWVRRQNNQTSAAATAATASQPVLGRRASFAPG
jgi:hypothetical protein